MTDKWYYMVDRNKIGPVTRDQILILLRRRVIRGHTPVWNSSMPRYVALESVDDLSPFIPEEEIETASVSTVSEQPPLKGFTKFLIPKGKKEPAAAANARTTRAPFTPPHKLSDEARAKPGNSRAPIPGAPPRASAPSSKDASEESAPSAVKQVTGAVSEGVRLIGATSLAAGAAVFGVFVLGLIDILVGAQRDAIYDALSWLIPREFMSLLDPVEWMGVLIVGGLVGSAASAGCGGRGNTAVAGVAALFAFLSVTIGAIFAEILAVSLESQEALATLVLSPEAWFEGIKALYHNLLEEPDDLLFLFGAAGEAFLISRHNYRKHEEEEANRVVDPFLRT
ncbi:MAG: DUF4339 domain-containing protein [Puniceicoccales bacterium]